MGHWYSCCFVTRLASTELSYFVFPDEMARTKLSSLLEHGNNHFQIRATQIALERVCTSCVVHIIIVFWLCIIAHDMLMS